MIYLLGPLLGATVGYWAGVTIAALIARRGFGPVFFCPLPKAEPAYQIGFS